MWGLAETLAPRPRSRGLTLRKAIRTWLSQPWFLPGTGGPGAPTRESWGAPQSASSGRGVLKPHLQAQPPAALPSPPPTLITLPWKTVRWQTAALLGSIFT